MWAIWGSVGLGPCAKAVPLSMQMAATAALSRTSMECSYGTLLIWDVADVVNAHLTTGQPKGSRKSAGKQKSMCCCERIMVLGRRLPAKKRAAEAPPCGAPWVSPQQALATPP